MPTASDPRRPLATTDRYQALAKVAESVTVRVRRNRRAHVERSCFAELLDVVAGTGRRIDAVCKLLRRDLHLNDGTPHGSIRWLAATSKNGIETVVPITATVRAALNRILAERPGIGAVPVFASPADPTRPMSRHLAHRLLLKAERLAGLAHLPGAPSTPTAANGRPSGSTCQTWTWRRQAVGPRARRASSSAISLPTSPRC